MQKRHFEALARALRETRPESAKLNFFVHQWGKDVERIADVCATTNVSFRRGQFYDACGFTAEYGRA